MNIYQKLLSALGFKAVSAPKNAEHVRAYRLFLGSQGTLRPRECWQLYNSVGTLAKSVDLIAECVASLKPVVKINGEIVEDHPALDVLAVPGFNRTRRRLIKQLAVQQLVTGNCYLSLLGNVKVPPSALDVLRAQNITIIEGPDGWPGTYQLNDQYQHQNFRRDPESIIDFRWFDGPFSEIIPIYDIEGDVRGVGLSPLQAVVEEINLKLTGMRHNRSLLTNGAKTSGVMSIKGSITPEQFASVREQAQEQLSGHDNAGRIMFASGDGLDFKPTTMSNVDMDYSELIKMVDDAIITRYSIPGPLYNSDTQTLDNYKESWRALYENAALPLFTVIYSGLARAFSQRFDEYIEFEHDKLSNSVLADAAVDKAIKLSGARLVTPNEAREEIGFEPMAGGDAIWDLPGMIPQFEDMWTGYEDVIDHESAKPRTPSKLEDQTGKETGEGARKLLSVLPGGAA